MKELIVFDLDGTLAESKSPLDAQMVELLNALLSVTRVAVISGGDWPQFDSQVLSRGLAASGLENLSLLPTCGAKFYRYQARWKKIYSEDLTGSQKQQIIGALKRTVESLGYQPEETWGETIEDRGTQITLSALGQQAPLAKKEKWDPDFAKRKKMKTILDDLIPEFSVRLGGTTSVDITRPGIDKAYGIGKLRDVLGVDTSGMLFIGDALFPGGNDYPAIEAGVTSIEVKDPDDTKLVIRVIVALSQGAPAGTGR